MSIQQLFEQALKNHQAGRLGEAERAYRQILSQDPRNPDALHLLGVIAHQSGHHDAAVELMGRAVAINPTHAGYRGNLGLALMETDQLDAAIDSFHTAIDLKRDFSEAHSNLGLALSRQNRLEEAKAAFEVAIRLRPDMADAYNGLGVALTNLGKLDEAVAAIKKAIAIRSDHSEAHNNLGNALAGQRNFGDAIEAFQTALRLNPGGAQIHANLGNASYEMGRLDEAIEAYQRAIALKPDYLDAMCKLGVVFQKKGRVAETVAVARRALAIDPDYADAHNCLGMGLRELGDMDQMIAAFQRAIDLNPELVEAHSNMGAALKDAGRLEEAMQSFEKAITLRPGDRMTSHNRLYLLNFFPNMEPGEILRRHRTWDTQYGQPLRRFIRDHSNDRSPDRRLRIGYVSSDLRTHSVAFFLVPLLEGHDREAFHVTCYATTSKTDRVTQRIGASADAWRDLVGHSDDEAAEIIRKDAIDILIDLSGHMPQNSLRIFARKPAPVQITYLGYPATTGMEAMDWRLTDSWADPAGTDEFHAEKLWRLPRTAWCFTPLSGSPNIEPVDRSHIVFGSFNDMAKVNSPLLRLWARVLREVPDSRLILKNRAMGSPAICEGVRKEMETFGIAGDRLELIPLTPAPGDHLRCYSRVDVGLDTYPYHGTTTTCEALWMGVPVVTLAGRMHVSRVGVSLLHNGGLHDLVAANEDEYVRIATELARDEGRRNTLRKNLRRMMQGSALMDGSAFARDVEAAFRGMWRQWISR